MTIQYIELAKRIINEGEWVTNERTGTRCLTVINADLVYDVGAGEFPLVTTRKSPIKLAIAELIGYAIGADSAAKFRELGTKSWDMNANDNLAWINNPFRKGKDDMGRVYGVQGRDWQSLQVLDHTDPKVSMAHDAFLDVLGYKERSYVAFNNTSVHVKSIDQLKKVYENLKNGIDDRGEIVTFWNPGEFHRGCLRPCMHTHTFSLVGDTLHLTSYQRSCDVPLGLVANMQQCYWLLAVMAHITGHKAGKAYHKIINAHIYEDQLELMKEQVQREPHAPAKADFNRDKIKTLEDFENATVDDFYVTDYTHDEPINYPFSV